MIEKRPFIRAAAAALIISLVLALMPAAALGEGYSAVVMEEEIPVYSDSALENQVGKLGRGTIVVVESTVGAAAQITFKKKSSYCDLSDIVAVKDMAEEAFINADGVKVYAKAKTSSKSRAVPKGTAVNVLGESGKWAMIEKDGVAAYIYVEYITYAKDMVTPTPTDEATPAPTPGLMDEVPAVVTADELPVYKKASASSEKLGTLKYGAEVTVMAYNTNWAYIQKDGKYGYCKVSGLTRKVDMATPTPEPDKTPQPGKDDYIPAVVAADSVPVYKEASTSSQKLGTLKKGAKVNVVSYDRTWAYIEKNGKFGYCKVKALTKESAEPTPTPTAPGGDDYRDRYPDVQFTATVIYEYAPVYAEPRTDSMSVKLSLATEVDVYAYNSSWAYVGMGDSRGFMQVKNLSAASYTELKSGDSGANVVALQEELLKKGYFDGVPGNSYSVLTSNAVKRFQAAIGASQTGTADVNTLRVLYGGYAPTSPMLENELSSGDSGSSVERLQTRLFYLGYLSKTDSLDGDYGTNTVIAVKLFQAEAELTQDGIAGVGMLRALYSTDAPKLPSGKNPADYTPGSGGTKPGVVKMPEGLASTMVNLPANATNAEKIEYVIYIGQNQLGKPYVYGTAGPNTFDCSGFTSYCYKKVNITLGRSAYAQGYQAASGTKIEGTANLVRGDLVFFDTITDSDLSDHAGIYIGKGYFIHASSGTGNGRQVCVSSLDSGYYQRVFSWGRRPLPQ